MHTGNLTKDKKASLCKADLIEVLARGAKPKNEWRVGTEHEKFLYDANYKRLSYDGHNNCSFGIEALLNEIVKRGFTPIYEGDNIIGALDKKGGSITLEPGGQLELSGRPLLSIHDTFDETYGHLKLIDDICSLDNIKSVGLGYDPITKLGEASWMPKDRYALMRAHMPKVGNLGIAMMTLTCTVQANLDFSSEVDMAKKMKVATTLQPLTTALFANSSIKELQKTKYQSYRSHCWTDTDAERCGMAKFTLTGNMTFEQWVDYLLDVPMYFVLRGGVYHNALGKSFRDFMDGNLEGFKGLMPTIDDWQNHLTTAFPEVRLKNFIEMRGADCGSLSSICALSALWVGLLYDDDAFLEVEQLCSTIDPDEVLQMRDNVPIYGLKTTCLQAGKSTSLRELAGKVLKIAKTGLKNRSIIVPKQIISKLSSALGEPSQIAGLSNHHIDRANIDERIYLAYPERIVESGLSNADLTSEVLAKNNNDVSFVIESARYKI